MTTIREYVAAEANRAFEMVAETYRLVEVNDVTAVSDAITDLIHLAEEIHDADYSRAHEHGSTEDETDTRRLALRTVETACAHYLAEAHAVRVEPEGDADGLGGYVNPNVRIAQADDGEELYAAACPSCGTLADIDGYCVDAGCSMVGKAVS